MTHSLSIPACQPDELITGTLYRVARLNGLRPSKDIVADTTREKVRRRSARYMELLAELLHIPRDDLIQRYTCAPFLGRFGVSLKQGSEQERRVGHAASTLSKRYGGFRVCHACAQEDVEWLGYSYWRRLHQLPGMRWCLKHQQPLTFVEAHPSLAFPHDALNIENGAYQAVPGTSPTSYAQHYMEVAAQLLIEPSRAPADIVLARLRERASCIGIDLCFQAVNSNCTLGDYARQLPEASSIAEQIQRSFHIKNPNPWRLLNQILSFPARGTAGFCIAACILYDNSDDALRVLCEAPAVTEYGCNHADQDEASRSSF